MDDSKRLPTLDAILDVLAICRLIRDEGCSIAEAGRRLGLRDRRDHNLLKDMSTRYGKFTYADQVGGVQDRLSELGETFCALFDACPDFEETIVPTLAAKKLSSFQPPLRLGMTDFFFHELFPGPWFAKLRNEPKCPEIQLHLLGSTPDSDLQNRQIDVVFGYQGMMPAIEGTKAFKSRTLRHSPPGTRRKVDASFEFVIVANPMHEIAARYREASGKSAVALDEIKDCELYLPETPFERWLPNLPGPERNCRRIEFPTFSAVIAMARLGPGIGIVPNHRQLDDLRRRGLIAYLPIATTPQTERLTLQATWPSHLGDRRIAFIQLLIDLFEMHLGLQDLHAQMTRVFRPAVLPRTAKHYASMKYAYFISQSQKDGIPRWYSATVETDPKSRAKPLVNDALCGFAGRLVDLSDDAGEVYPFEAALLPGQSPMLLLIGKDKVGTNRFTATFNGSIATNDVVIGHWTGFDGNVHYIPTTAPILLSRTALSFRECHRIIEQSEMHIMPNIAPPDEA